VASADLPSLDIDSFLESLALILAEESLESVLQYGVRLVAGTAHCEVAALFVIERGQVAAEFWHPADAETSATFAPSFRSAAITSSQQNTPFAVLPPHHTPSGLAFRVVLSSAHGDQRIALCLSGPEGPDPDNRIERRVQRLAELLVSRAATQERQARSEAQRQRYERWFKTLDQQLGLLDRERQKFSAVVSQSDLYVYVADVSRTIRWTNKAMGSFMRSDDQQSWLGRSCSDVCGGIHGGGERCEQCPLMHALDANQPAHQELFHNNIDSVSTFYMTALPIRGPDGVPKEVLVLLQDLTDLRVLRKSESRYRLLFERSANAILMVRPSDYRIVLANGTAGRTFGCRSSALAGHALSELHAPSEWKRLEPRYNRVMSEPSSEGFECVLLAMNGDERDAVAFTTRFDLEQEEVMMIEFLDITARKRAERTLWEREEQLRQSQRIEAVGKLAGGIAHDFNNLLSVVMGRTELVLERLGPDHPQRSDLAAIHSATTRGAWLVRQLLAFGQQEIASPRRLDLRDAVGDLVELMRSLIGERIELDVVQCDEPAEIRSDRAQIEQLLVNLVINARDAMPHGGRVTIGVGRLEVGDPSRATRHRSGRALTSRSPSPTPGTDGRDHARPLVRAVLHHQGERRGSGLGLSVVYGIVTQHGGHVQVASERGRGTSVRVSPAVRHQRSRARHLDARRRLERATLDPAGGGQRGGAGDHARGARDGGLRGDGGRQRRRRARRSASARRPRSIC
jgi:PAS domain S-box-containing protein